MARAYIGIANGSPWVVPSRDQTMFPSTKSLEGFLYVLMRMVAMGGQIRWIFCRVECLLRALKALLASTRRTPSTSSFWKACLTMWMAASVPDGWPAQPCTEPAASMTSPPTRNRTALAMIRLAGSQILIGLMPGFLSMAIRRQANRGEMLLGSTKEVQIRMATFEREWQRSLEACLNAVHSLLQQYASRPECPAEPCMIGLMPAFLLMEIRRQANRGEMLLGSTKEVQIRMATFERELQRSLEACLNAVHSLLQQYASRPEGPAEPCMWRAAVRIVEASRASKMMG